MVWEVSQQPYWDSAKNQFYIKTSAIGKPAAGVDLTLYNDGSFMPYRKQYIGAGINNTPSLFNSASISTAYTPNPITAAQLAGSGSGGGSGGGVGTVPMWMQQAYANKMAGMGAPANGPLPYQLTASSFRGMPASGSQVAPVGVAGKAGPRAAGV